METSTTTTTTTDRRGPAASRGAGPAILIVTHDSEDDLAAFLPGQARVAAALGVPLVVADNASTDRTVELVRSQAAGPAEVRLIEMGRNAGYAAAVNAGVRAAEGDVLLLNPDVELAGPEPVRALSHLLAEHPNVAVAGPRLVGPGGERQASARAFPSLLAVVGAQGRLTGFGPIVRARDRYLAPSQASSAASVDWVIGAAMLIRRQAFETVGGWDERFFLYVEDADFCRRCVRAGWRVAYVPEVTLRHRYRRLSSGHGKDQAARRARRLHLTGFARLFAHEPRLLLGRGRGRVVPLGDDSE